MTVISNPLLLKKKAAAGGSDYQIEKSLRFSEDDDAYLSRNANLGNRRTWTLNFWFKRTTTGGQGSSDYLFGCGPDSSNTLYVYMDATTLRVYNAEGGSNDVSMTTNQVFRDPAAWQMHTLAIDTTQSVASERLKYYINGKQITSWGNATYPSQNAQLQVNKNVNHYIGRTNDGSTDPLLDGYLADVQLIDSLALNPAAFGSFNDSQCWNPKAFALSTPNTTAGSPTWSGSGFSGDAINSSYPATKMFDGASDTQLRSNGTEATIHWAPSGGIKYNQSVRVNSYFSGNILVNDGDENIALSGSALTWHTVAAGSGTLDKLTFTSASGNVIWVSQIEVDGVILVDGQTDVATRNNVNNGTKWSDLVTGTAYTNQGGDKAFDGRTDTLSQASNPGEASLTFKPTTAITGRVEILIAAGDHGGAVTGQFDLKIGNVSKFDNSIWPDNTTGWVDLGTQTIDTTYGLVWGNSSGGNWHGIKMIKIDGHVMLDTASDNSFHLKFNDTSSNDRLGRNSFNKGIEDSSVNGALPIYNTTAGSDGYDNGETKATSGTLYREDNKPGGSGGDAAGTTNGTGLVFAMPGDTLTDIHASINTGSSNKDITNVNTVSNTTSTSRFYGSSIDMTSVNGQYLHTTNSSSDFTFSNGSFTIECWFKYTVKDSSDPGLFQFSTTSTGHGSYAGGIYVMLNSNDNNIYVNVSDDQTGYTPAGSLKAEGGVWTHFALVGEGGNKVRAYVNGTLSLEKSGDYNVNNSTYATIGKYYNNDNYNFGGYINDFRVYKGVAKYSASFTPPTRKDFEVTNITAVGTDTGIAFDDGTTAITGTGYSQTAKISFAANSTQKRFKHKHPSGTTRYFFSDQSHSYTETHSNEQGGNTMGYRSGSTMSANGVFATANSVSAGISALSITGLGPDDTTFVVDTTANKIWMSMDDGETWLKGGDPSDTSSTATLLIPDDTALWFWSTPYTSTNETILTSLSATDALIDSPTNYGTDTGAGGEVRGNYCTWNPLDMASTQKLFNGNLDVGADSDNWRQVKGNIGVNSGKYYWEISPITSTNINAMIGITDATESIDTYPGDVSGYSYVWGGNKYEAGTYTASVGASWSKGDVIGVALDCDGGTIKYYINNSLVLTSNISTTKTWFPAISVYYSDNDIPKYATNFGQRAFKYTAPTGYKCLCTQNLSDTFDGEAAGTVNNPSKYFDVLTYTGTGTTQDIKGLAFEPDFTWVKSRSNAVSGMIFDQIRTNGSDQAEYIFPDLTNASAGPAADVHNAWLTDGYQLGGNTHSNNDGYTYVGWNWDAGTAAATASTDGSITPSVQWKNAIAGFSITKYGGGGNSVSTVGHGLNAPPELIIVKNTTAADDWAVYHKEVGNTKDLCLNSDAGPSTRTMWNDTSPTNTVFTLGAASGSDYHNRVNQSGQTYIAYCWTPIAGYSAFGSYSDDVFVYTGFKPKFLLIKASTSTQAWWLLDSERDSFNVMKNVLKPDNTAEVSSTNVVDFLSNGFKIRTSAYEAGDDGNTYIYAAFAEHPFKTARAR